MNSFGRLLVPRSHNRISPLHEQHAHKKEAKTTLVDLCECVHPCASLHRPTPDTTTPSQTHISPLLRNVSVPGTHLTVIHSRDFCCSVRWPEKRTNTNEIQERNEAWHEECREPKHDTQSGTLEKLLSQEINILPASAQGLPT